MDTYSGLHDCIWSNVCKNMESPCNFQKCKNEEKGESRKPNSIIQCLSYSSLLLPNFCLDEVRKTVLKALLLRTCNMNECFDLVLLFSDR